MSDTMVGLPPVEDLGNRRELHLGEDLINETELMEMFEEECRDFFSSHPPFNQEYDYYLELEKFRKKEAGHLDWQVFKKRLIIQRLAAAKLQAFIEKALDLAPNTRVDLLKQLVMVFSKAYGFTSYTTASINNMLEALDLNRRNFSILRDRYSAAAIFNVVFGYSAHHAESMEMTVSPFSVDIVMSDLEFESLLKHIDPSNAQTCGGFSFCTYVYSNLIYFTVLPKSSTEFQTVLVHEHQHNLNGFYSRHLNFENNRFVMKDSFKAFKEETDLEMRKKYLETYFTYCREVSLEYVKDEILAMLRDQASNYFEEFFSPGGYDFAHKNEDRDQVDLDEYWTQVWDEMHQKIRIDDYRMIIINALAAFSDLRDKTQLSVEEAVALFADKPLAEWGSVARRVVRYTKIEVTNKPRLQKLLNLIRKIFEPPRNLLDGLK